jgi:hypothetical protein
MKGAVADTIGTKSGMADTLVVVLTAQDRIVSLSGYPAEQGNSDVTCPQQGNQNVRREMPWPLVSKQLCTGHFYRGSALKL